MHDPYWQYFEYLRYEIEKLHKEQEAIRRQISEIKPVHVDKLEYKIQELNIEKLSGLLNLGLSLNGDGKHMMELAEKIIDEEGVSVDFGKAKKTDSQQSD
jgi:spore germination protein PC